MPVVTVPLPSAQVVPVNVMVRLKIFFPLARGVASPDAAHPLLELVTTPVAVIPTIDD